MASTRIISVIGRKNAGKTTLAVALISELARRGHRVMTIKHGHHPASVDQTAQIPGVTSTKAGLSGR